MGGESIKPIRKRIHVYFLMTTYLVLEKFYILAILILISLPSTLIIATTQSHTVYLKGVIFNICISFLICLYPLYLFDNMITYGFLIYCLIDYFILKKKWNRTLEQYLTTDDSTPLITNRDQFVLDYEVQHGRIWQLKYHIPLIDFRHKSKNVQFI